MKKIGIISQARMTSTRLPAKVLKEVRGKSILQYHVERLAASGYPLYIATTTNATDDVLIDYCQQKGIPYHRGSEDNVLSRYYECAVKYGLEVVVRVTSDCPLIDGNIVRQGVEAYLAANDPMLYLANGPSATFPRGFDFEVLGFNVLEEAYQKATLDYEREHVTPYLYQGKNPAIRVQPFAWREAKNQYRITLDTPDDFELIRRLIEDYRADELDCAGIIALLDAHPELVAINAHIEQKKLGQ